MIRYTSAARESVLTNCSTAAASTQGRRLKPSVFKSISIAVPVTAQGTGRIAKRAVREMAFVDGLELSAVYNPNYEHALEFAEKLGSGSHLAMPHLGQFAEAVDAVYIATPHGFHYDYVKRMLTAGKHVLCEKPMVFDPEQAGELYEIAAEKGTVLMEAIKTAYCPGFKKIEEVVESGVIGDVVDVEAAFTRLTDPPCREFDPGAFGGAFTEFGTYTMLPIFRFLGIDYSEVVFRSIGTDTGVDGYTKALFSYGADCVDKNDKDECGCIHEYKMLKNVTASAVSKTGLTAKSEGQLIISGTKGYILVPSPWWLTKYFEVHYEDPRIVDKYTCEFEGDGLRYEFREFAERINKVERQTNCAISNSLLTKTINTPVREKDEALARARTYKQFLYHVAGEFLE